MTSLLLNNRYQVIDVLGNGGFGKTFLTEDIHMPSHRRCVLKQLIPIEHDPQKYQVVQGLFRQEAALLEALGEGNDQIPSLYAYFEEAGQFYLVQEWIEGQTLAAKVENLGLQSEPVVHQLLEQTLLILEYIHARSIIHRDIKPDNIILRAKDTKPVLIDFGAVKQTVRTLINSQGQTTQSIVIGTPGFMCPEQARGRPLFSSDLYGLGFTAIYLLTGRMPGQLTDPRTGQVQWRDYVSVSDGFAAILDRAIQDRPSDRYMTAQAMLQALRSLSSGTPSPVSTVLPNSVPATTPILSSATNPVAPVRRSIQGSTHSNSAIHSSISHPRRSQVFLGLGALATVTLVSAGGYYGWQWVSQWRSQQVLQTALVQARADQGRGAFPECITTAQMALQSATEIANPPPVAATEVKQLLDHCTLSQDQGILSAAQAIATQTPNPNLEQAITKIKEIGSASPLYRQAQAQRFKWQAIVLEQYLRDSKTYRPYDEEAATLAQLASLIQPSVEVNAETVAIRYTTGVSPNLREDDAIRTLGALFMEILQGHVAESIPAKYTDFTQLIVYPGDGDRQAIIPVQAWRDYVDRNRGSSSANTFVELVQVQNR